MNSEDILLHYSISKLTSFKTASLSLMLALARPPSAPGLRLVVTVCCCRQFSLLSHLNTEFKIRISHFKFSVPAKSASFEKFHLLYSLHTA